jgi:CheY-like chemotaxis protein
VVDDEEAILNLMPLILEGHDVVVASSGREAIELLSTMDFDLMFVDLVMPDKTGMDVYEYLVEKDPDAVDRMVFMSGGVFTERARRFLETATVRRLEKPFSPEQVLEYVDQLPDEKPRPLSGESPVAPPP